MRDSRTTAGRGRFLLTCAYLGALGFAPGAALAQSGGMGVQVYAAANSGGWSKTETSMSEGDAPVRYEFSSGAGAGVRLSYSITPALALWASGEMNVEQEGPFAGLLGGVGTAVPLGARARLRGRLGAGWLAEGPFGIVGATAEWLMLRRLGLGVGVEVLRPIGTGSRYTGLQDVDVEYDGGPSRLVVELGWSSRR